MTKSRRDKRRRKKAPGKIINDDIVYTGEERVSDVYDGWYRFKEDFDLSGERVA